MLTKLFILLAISSTWSYTIIGDDADVFPVQRAIDRKSFVRVDPRHGVQFISCPDEYVFDAEELKCVYAGDTSKGIADDYCPTEWRGTLPYRNNCRLYVSCWDGAGAVQKCGLNLVYNERRGHCDYPEISDCCEFRAKNKTILINHKY